MQCVSSVGIDIGTLGSMKMGIPHGLTLQCLLVPEDFPWTLRPLDNMSMCPQTNHPILRRGGGNDLPVAIVIIHRLYAVKIQVTQPQSSMFWDTLVQTHRQGARLSRGQIKVLHCLKLSNNWQNNWITDDNIKKSSSAAGQRLCCYQTENPNDEMSMTVLIKADD
jgi:hypothetical protein